MADMDARLLLLDPKDNVVVLRAAIDAGETIIVSGQPVQIKDRIGMGHKLARRDIIAGDKVLKYGVPIGSATRIISPGEHVHLSNLKSDYTATYALTETGRAEHLDWPEPQTPPTETDTDSGSGSGSVAR